MRLSILDAVLRRLIDPALVRSRPAAARDLELPARRHAVRVRRRAATPNRWWPGDRRVPTAPSRTLARSDRGGRPVRPETVPSRHRELPRRGWAVVGRRRRTGRPPRPAASRELGRRPAAEHPAWGDQRIRGESLEPGHDLSATAIRTILRRHGRPPAPRRAGLTRPAVRRAHAGAVLAGDVRAVETVRLQTPDVLVVVAVRTRRVLVVGCTAHPTGGWVTQPARDPVREIGDSGRRPTLRIRDRDAEVTRSVDELLRSEGARVVRTPVRAPRADAHAERRVCTVGRECVDGRLIVGRRHPERVLREDTDHDDTARPPQARGSMAPPARGQISGPTGEVVRHDRLGGLIHEDERQAA